MTTQALTLHSISARRAIKAMGVKERRMKGGK